MDTQNRAVALPKPIPNESDATLLEGALSLQLKLSVNDEELNEKFITRSFDNLNPIADATAIRTFAEKVADYTNCNNLSECIVISKTSIMG